jgi:hypothetical protein
MFTVYRPPSEAPSTTQQVTTFHVHPALVTTPAPRSKLFSLTGIPSQHPDLSTYQHTTCSSGLIPNTRSSTIKTSPQPPK